MASPVKLEPGLESLLANLQTLLTEAEQRGRREGEAQGIRRWSERTNQAARRMRQAGDAEAWGQMLAEAAAVPSAAVFRKQGDKLLKLVGVQGDHSPEAAAVLREKGIQLESLPAALANAFETKDTVVALRTRSELSGVLVELFPQSTAVKAHLLPLLSRRQPTGLLYLLAGEQPIDLNAMELLATMAEASWQERADVAPVPTSASPLLQIAPVAAVKAPAKRGWDQLNADERDLHLRAQNFARSVVSRLLLRQHDVVLTGREMGNLYTTFEKSLDGDRRAYRERFMHGQPSMVDYLHVELVRTLAEGNEALLGPEYPGPLG